MINENQEEREWLDQCSQDPRIEKLVIEGIESGGGGPMSKEDWDSLKRSFLKRLNEYRGLA